MKILLLVPALFFSINIHSQKVTHKDLIGHWIRISPIDKNITYYIDFIDSTHYNLVDTGYFDLPFLKSEHGTLYANYELDSSTEVTTIETWTGTNPQSRFYHTDFYALRKKSDTLFMKYVKPKNATWQDNDTVHLKIYKLLNR